MKDLLILKNVSVKLDQCKSRNEVRKLLEIYKKGELLFIAKESEIYVNNKFDKQQIIDRLVEATAGAAIRYKVLKGEL